MRASGSFTGHEFSRLRQPRFHDPVADPAGAGERPRLQHRRHHAPPDRRRVRARAHDRNRRLARRSVDARAVAPPGRVSRSIRRPSKGRRKAISPSISSSARPRVPTTRSSTRAGRSRSFQIEKFLADEKLEAATASFQADRESLKIVGDGTAPRRPDPYRGQPRGGRGGLGDRDFCARRRRAREARDEFRLVADRERCRSSSRRRSARTSAEVEIDLTPAGIDNPVPGVSKPAGKPGKATFVVKPAPEGSSLSNVAIDLGVPMMRGIGSDGRRRRHPERDDHPGAHRFRRRLQGRRRQ